MVKYKYGKKVRIKTYKVRPYEWNSEGKMDKWMGQIVTMDHYGKIKESKRKWSWKEKDFEEIEGIFKKIDNKLFRL